MSPSILLHFTTDDEPYLGVVKRLIAGRATVRLSNKVPVTATEVALAAKNAGCSAVATTSPVLLKLLLDGKMSKRNWYAGSIIEKLGVEFLILNPLEQLLTIPAAPLLFKRHLSKILQPQNWLQLPPFKWELFNPASVCEYLELAHDSNFIAIDIETGMEGDRVITCIGFCMVHIEDGSIQQTTIVVPMLREESWEFNLAFVRNICGCSVPKVFQNGKYDNAYLLRFGIPVYNYLGDTINLFHSWYCELPKRLDFITSFLLRKSQYWKNESNNPIDSIAYYTYNAKDCYNTAMDWLTLLKEAPPYAWQNYLKEFPLVFPCILAENRGLRRDNERMEAENKRFEASLEEQLLSIRTMVSNSNFNPSSAKQTLLLLQALGSGDLGGTGKIPMDKAKTRHPLNNRILSAIGKYREDRKLQGTYLRDIDPESGETKSWNGRIFYTLNPHGTDTGRLASSESHFWCGWNIQNIPRDRDDIQIRAGIIADPGFYLGECDRSQAETRNTAYLSGDEKLLVAVEDKSRDFHSINASAFFGIPYDRITASKFREDTKTWEHKILDKPLRDLSKRTNHGANYNMGAKVLLDTMGTKNVLRARQLLKLPRNWSLLQITQYLLDTFSNTYPTVKGAFYDCIKNSVTTTKILVGPTGWTRYCFGNPSTNKRHLNAYIAHVPQSLNAMELNFAYMRVFYEIALIEKEDFKLGPQIHDSILFQYRKGREDLAFKVAECMRNPLTVTDVFGKSRIMLVPTDLKGEATTWSEVRPMYKKEKICQLSKGLTTITETIDGL
jgi:DNA polymerase I-like protein with 3'-5' exonuclease and polymerase domains